MTTILSELLPINPQSINGFISQPLSSKLINSSTNSFFKPSNDYNSVQLRDGEDGCWQLLPQEWRDYFDGFRQKHGEEREALLKDLAQTNDRNDYPASLGLFLNTCKSLSLNRTMSDIPILSYPPTPHDARPPFSYEAASTEKGKKEKRKQMRNEDRAGLNPKKEHEVKRFTELVRSIVDEDEYEEKLTHVIDIGSGRAHLSRSLSSPPLSLHVLALDHSSSQITGAERLDVLKSRPPPSSSPISSPTPTGSLTHRTSSLDESSIGQVLREWPEDGGASVVGLHACGDLTVDTLKAFVKNKDKEEKGRKMVVVGCCYNLMNPSQYPLSTHFSALSPSLTLTRPHLLISPQSPSLWHLNPSSLSSSLQKLLFRARLEVELIVSDPLRKNVKFVAQTSRKGMDVEKGGNGVSRIGRISSRKSTSWEEYRTAAVQRYGSSIPSLSMERDYAFEFQLFWTLRCLLGPVLESLIVMDRWCYLVEQYEGIAGKKVELRNLFDQRTGSERNLALVVR